MLENESLAKYRTSDSVDDRKRELEDLRNISMPRDDRM